MFVFMSLRRGLGRFIIFHRAIRAFSIYPKVLLQEQRIALGVLSDTLDHLPIMVYVCFVIIIYNPRVTNKVRSRCIAFAFCLCLWILTGLRSTAEGCWETECGARHSSGGGKVSLQACPCYQMNEPEGRLIHQSDYYSSFTVEGLVKRSFKLF